MRVVPPKRSSRENVIPLINVVFLLLIFFMITGQIRQPDAVDIALPFSMIESSKTGEGKEILLTKSGDIYLAGEQVSLSGLAAMNLLNPGEILKVKIDGTCKRDCFLPFFKALSDMGIDKISLVTIQGSKI